MDSNMTRLSFLICFLVPCSSLFISGHGHRSLPKKHVALFIFGDSMFDAGNNIHINTTVDFKRNFWPYGETFFKYPTGRASDGRLIPDFIAEYANLPYISTFLPSCNDQFIYGVNFASVGSGALVETNQGLVIDLKSELNHFKIAKKHFKKQLGDTGAKSLLSNAVYILNPGSNDYYAALMKNLSVFQSDYFKKEYVGMVIGNLTTTIKEIYKRGGRKFGLVSLGPIGCTPGMRALSLALGDNTGSCLEVLSKLARLHNKALSKILTELESEFTGFKYANHDFYNSAMEILNNPSKYGLKEIKMACCGSGPYRGINNCGGNTESKEYEVCDNPKAYFFFDTNHLSGKASKLIADLLWSGTPDVTGPYNLKTFFEKS